MPAAYAEPASRRGAWMRANAPMLLVAVAGCAASLAAFSTSRSAEEARAQVAFREVAALRAAAIQATMEGYAVELASVSRFFAASDWVDRAEFRSFVGGILEHRPAMRLIGWAPRLTPALRGQIEQQAREEGMADFRFVRRVGDEPPDLAALRTAYVEPGGAAEGVLGTSAAQAFGEELLRQAARAQTLAAVPDDAVRPTLVTLATPLLGPSDAPDPIPAPLHPVDGYLVARLDTAALLADATAELPTEAIEPVLTCREGYGWEDPSSDPDRGPLVYTRNFPLGGLEWTILCEALPEFHVSHGSRRPWAVLFACLLLSAVLAAYVREVTMRAAKVQTMVEERTAALADANARLREEVEERLAAEARIRTQAEELTRSNAALEQFAYIASHDLQEPLRKVLAFGDRLEADAGERLGERGADYLRRMQDAAKRMQALIEGLLTYSRVTTKAQPLSPVDLAQVAREVLSDLEIRIEAKGATVRTGALPTVVADALQMRQLLQNLIGNALKFHREGVAPMVRISGRALEQAECGELGDGRWGRIEVEDEGIGFDAKHAERIFGVFQRLHGRGVYEGTGIGLAVCRKIAERHGGRITARSRPDTGSVFAVDLPLADPKEDAQ